MFRRAWRHLRTHGSARHSISQHHAQNHTSGFTNPEVKGRRSIPFYSMPKTTLQIKGQDLVSSWLSFFMKKIDNLSPWFGFPLLSNPNFLRESITLVQKYCHVGKLRQPLDFCLWGEGSRGQILSSLQSNWWISMASWPSTIVWSGP